MKSYSQFVYESYSARENIQEALPLIPIAIGAGKAISWGLAAWQAYEAAKKIQQGDYKGAALDVALAVPSAGWAGAGARALRLGARGTTALKYGTRIAKGGAYTKMAADELGKENGDTTSSSSSANSGSTSQPPASQPPASQPPASQPPASQPPASQPPASQPPSSSTPTPKSGNVLAKKGGVEGVLDKSTGKWTKKDWGEAGRARYQQARGAEQIKKDAEKVNSAPTTAPNLRQQIDKTIAQIKAKQDSGAIRNPFRPGTSSTTTRPTTTRPTTPAPTTPSGGVVADRTPTPKKPTPVVTKPKQRFDIRDRDIRARAGFDPRYDRR